MIAGVDLGKSRCRVAIADADGNVLSTADGSGASGLADPERARAAVESIGQLILTAAERAGTGSRHLTTVSLGAAGVLSPPAIARSLAETLRSHTSVDRVVVTSDAITSHLGALGGRPGVVTAVGTGAVTLGIGADGRSHRVDGWGQWLGDDGSGAWIGRAALQAVVRAVDGRGPATALTTLAEKRYGPLDELPAALPFDAGLPRATAAFAPDVVACADEGDDVAASIVTAAVACWVEATCAAAAAVDERTVTCVGGLGSVAKLRDAWARRLPPELVAVAAAGDSVAGAVLLALRDDLPHESQVYRDSG